MKSDPLQLCILDEDILGLPGGGQLQILATYWSFPSNCTFDSQLDPQDEIELRRVLYHRIAQYLSPQSDTSSLLEYAQTTIQDWLQRHLGRPGRNSICGGRLQRSLAS